MHTFLLTLSLIAAAAGLTACELTTRPADPNALLPPGDRPPPGPGLLTGEDSVYKVIVD